MPALFHAQVKCRLLDSQPPRRDIRWRLEAYRDSLNALAIKTRRNDWSPNRRVVLSLPFLATAILWSALDGFMLTTDLIVLFQIGRGFCYSRSWSRHAIIIAVNHWVL
jgi:hypothetical protein